MLPPELQKQLSERMARRAQQPELVNQVTPLPEEVVENPEVFVEQTKPTQKARKHRKTKQSDVEVAFQVNRTPLPLIRQLYCFLRDDLGLRPNYILDPCAGDGRFQQVALEPAFFPDACTVGVEPRVEEVSPFPVGPASKHLWHQQTFEAAQEHLGWFDLAAGNPPFMCLTPKDGKSWVPQLLKFAKVVVLLGQDDLGQRSVAGAELFNEYPPTYQLRIRGAIAFREDGHTDARDYSWWIWMRGAPRLAIVGNRPQWICIDLPRLASPERKL